MTATTPEPVVDTPKRGVIAAAVALAAHAVVVLAGFVAPRLIGPSEGFQDLAAVVLALFGGEIIVTLVCVIVSAVQFRRGQRHTGIGLMSGWLVGFVIVGALLFL